MRWIWSRICWSCKYPRIRTLGMWLIIWRRIILLILQRSLMRRLNRLRSFKRWRSLLLKTASKAIMVRFLPMARLGRVRPSPWVVATAGKAEVSFLVALVCSLMKGSLKCARIKTSSTASMFHISKFTTKMASISWIKSTAKSLLRNGTKSLCMKTSTRTCISRTFQCITVPPSKLRLICSWWAITSEEFLRRRWTMHRADLIAFSLSK